LFIGAAVLAGLGAFLLGGVAAADGTTPSASIVVTVANDVVNGDTSSPAALAAHPGADGISLREAVLAADNAASGAHVYVRFADSLAGSSIHLEQADPLRLTHDDLTVMGFDSSGGSPAVSIVASPTFPACATFLVEASNVEIRRLAFLGGGPGGVESVLIRGGTGRGGSAADSPCLSTPGPASLHDIGVDENTFANLAGTFAGRISVITGNAEINRVRISDNTFTGPGTDDGDAVFAQNWADHSVIDALTIEGNTFDGVFFSIELQPGASGDRWNDSPATGDEILDTHISRNVFKHSGNPVWMGTLAFGDLASGNVMDGTIIDGNIFDMGSIQSGITLTGGADNANGNTIENTRIVDNLMFGDQPAILLNGGGEQNASGNNVTGIEIANDTIASATASPALWSGTTYGSGTGNSVTGIDVRNTIFWGAGWPFTGDSPPTDVEFSVVKQPGFAGVNGNIAADPRFVNPAGGDYHLSASSPAIDAGTSDMAPAFDLDDRARVGAVDIGAYEYGATPRPRLDIDVDENGGGGVVASAPAGIDCPTECSAPFDQGAVVTLSATPDTWSRFIGWSGACSGSGDCQVTVAAETSVGATFAGLPPPEITGFSPESGGIGTTVAISGSGFTGATAVTIGGTPAASVSVTSDSLITAVVAPGTGSGRVAVTTSTGMVMSDETFIILPAPAISGFNPGQGSSGTSVTVTGSNFTGATSVKLRGIAAVFALGSATQLSFTVPVGAATGSILVTTPGGMATSAHPFVVVALHPLIFGLSPGQGMPGSAVTILGQNLAGASAVTFGGVPAISFSSSNGSITATVPAAALTGHIVVTTPGGTATSMGLYTVVPLVALTPTIASFTPSAGIHGVQVRIMGSGFTGATSVKFNGVAASFTVLSDSSIKAIVPLHAATGHIAVTTPGGTATSAANFTI
jgi:hypothetical protein